MDFVFGSVVFSAPSSRNLAAVVCYVGFHGEKPTMAPQRLRGEGMGGNTRVWGSFYRGIKGKHYSKNLKRVGKRKMKRGEMES